MRSSAGFGGATIPRAGRRVSTLWCARGLVGRRPRSRASVAGRAADGAGASVGVLRDALRTAEGAGALHDAAQRVARAALVSAAELGAGADVDRARRLAAHAVVAERVIAAAA